MQVAILGPLQVRAAGRDVPLAGARLRQLLVRLAAAPGQPVSTTALTDAIWPDDPPAEAVNALQALVSRLRRALGDPDAVVPTPGGYRLAVAVDDVDATRFSALARAGRDALQAGDPPGALRVLTEAQALWRGEPLAEAGGAGYAAPLVARWTELRLDAVADRIDALVRLGRAAEALPDLEEMVAAHPCGSGSSGS